MKPETIKAIHDLIENNKVPEENRYIAFIFGGKTYIYNGTVLIEQKEDFPIEIPPDSGTHIEVMGHLRGILFGEVKRTHKHYTFEKDNFPLKHLEGMPLGAIESLKKGN